jgi:hypothetical protein
VTASGSKRFVMIGEEALTVGGGAGLALATVREPEKLVVDAGDRAIGGFLATTLRFAHKTFSNRIPHHNKCISE